MDNGQVVEQGAPDELLAALGAFFELRNARFAAAIEEAGIRRFPEEIRDAGDPMSLPPRILVTDFRAAGGKNRA